ncbi:hypothetical protein KR52_03380 [Synechococcus sp. KORDI-52]|uniref:hypothetical protein n=1 Tax=Synechococcus sp. KORDI-52 TaxID=585425 RepID=UPI0004E07E49|nr:hypothetical protein [Synechococcus sp. KORDI-52]AII48199.1 hypothetical protein KR52_03380 [Synechococcus sp. KORDI-52]
MWGWGARHAAGPLLSQPTGGTGAAQLRGLFREELQPALTLTDQRPLRVTSLACGPASEVFDILL